MTEERRLLYIHKVLHEDAKHRQEDMKTLQKEHDFAAFCKTQDSGFLACPPNTCPAKEECEALAAMEVSALSFPCVRFADNGKSAMGMWLAETKDGTKAIAAEFLPWGDEWKLWKLILDPTTDNLPAQPYERKYPDPKEKPAEMPAFGGPGGPPPGGGAPGGGPGGPGPEGGAPGGGPGGPGSEGGGPGGGPGGPGGGEDSPPFDPDARSDVFDMDGDYARLNKDIVMLSTMALPDYTKASAEADALMEKCRKVVSPAYSAERVKREL